MRLPLSAVLTCLCTAVISAAPAPLVPTARLRPQGAKATELLERAKARSPTVQRIVDRLEAGDVIVYVELNDRLDPRVAACLTWVAATDSRRIVRASIKPRLREREAIAFLAHELQHAVEVLEHPEVRSTDGLADLYTRIGHRSSPRDRHFDTAEAIATGELAANELRRTARPATARATGAL
jgi:hypothetical protein